LAFDAGCRLPEGVSDPAPLPLLSKKESNIPSTSADVRGGGRLRDEPKERLCSRLGFKASEAGLAGRVGFSPRQTSLG